MKRELPWGKLVALGLVAALVAVVVAVVRSGSTIPEDVQPISWSHDACAHCGMLVGDPAHAAQLITEDGDVLVFDDPGCALRYVDEHSPRIHRWWFHHGTGERWIPADATGFLTGGTTPMGLGLSAVERDTAGSIDLAAATRVAKEHR